MQSARALLAALTIVAVTAAAATPLTDSVAWARRGLKGTAGKLKLRSSLSRAVRDGLRGAIRTTRRPEERQLIDLPGQSQTVRMEHGVEIVMLRYRACCPVSRPAICSTHGQGKGVQ